MRILLTGATGFLGSHLAEVLLEAGHTLLLTKRNLSDLWRCSTFIGSCTWINTDEEQWQDEVIVFQPEAIINTAWEGVSAGGRNDWEVQLSNISFQQTLLSIADKAATKLFIGLGSQAEYGCFDGCIPESYPTNPTTAYGATKLASLNLLKAFCTEKEIRWLWFRLFSCFGEREGKQWLIPSTIQNILTKESMDATLGEQRYAYLYVKDVARIIAQVLEQEAPSDIYHISAEMSCSIKELVSSIRDCINPDFPIYFGAIPYRGNQSMLMQGDMRKTNNYLNDFTFADFDESLQATIRYYKEEKR